TKEPQVGALDFEAVSGIAVTVLVFSLGQSTFNIDLFTFSQVLARELGLVSPERDPETGGQVLKLPRPVFSPFSCSDREVAHSDTLRCISEFGVAPEIADNRNLIERCHKFSLQLLKILPEPRPEKCSEQNLSEVL